MNDLERGMAFLDARAKEPSCPYANGRFVVRDDGVFFEGRDKEDEPLPPRWICSRLVIVAMTRDAKSGEWGRLLEWQDADGAMHRWAMPMELLQSDGSDVRRELARMGLHIAPGKTSRELLSAYLQVWPVDARARCVDRLGWHGNVFVTPSEAVGESDEIIVFQNANAIEPALGASGAVEAWRDTVGRLAAGNSRLVFALSAAFAGSLLDVVGEDSGGFHLRGASSSGKSTALKVAASVWGDPAVYPRLWRATANGLEGLAAVHNDGLLILDELGQIDPRQAGEAAYLLANGQGKTRANRTGMARAAARWRLLFLSAGEVGLADLMASAGHRATAGQEIRLADIEADAGRGMGLFEELHGHSSPAAFALALKDAASRYYGAAGMEWLRRIVADRAKLSDILAGIVRKFAEGIVPAGASGQVVRVARRFGLVAAAGELATRYGLTGWQEGEAVHAAKVCFLAWLEGFGGAGNQEERAILAQVQAFIEAHGDSRFQRLHTDDPRTIQNRVGFVRQGEKGDEYLILPEAFRREVVKGFDPKAAVRALLKAGWLVPGGDGRPTQKPRIPGKGLIRCYVLRPDFADQPEKHGGHWGQRGQAYESMGYVSPEQNRERGHWGQDDDGVPAVPNRHHEVGTPEAQYLRGVPAVPAVPAEIMRDRL